jgi:hypothetical protein
MSLDFNRRHMLSLIVDLFAIACFLCYGFSLIKSIPPQVLLGVGLTLAVIARIV